MGRLKAALIHNLKPPVKDPGLPADYYSECDSPKTVAAIAAALEKAGYQVFTVEGDKHLPKWLSEHPVDFAFNITEGFWGDSREARVPALLELMEIPSTGSGVLTLALAMDKNKSKQIFRQTGVPTPNYQLFASADDKIDGSLKYPLIVKPNSEGSAKGISSKSVVRDEASLRAQVRSVMETYGQEALVEEYIEGLELTVGILGDQALPILEVDFTECGASGEYFYSWRMKEFQGNQQMHLDPKFFCPARLPEEAARAVKTVALKAAKALGARDISRVDIRLSSDGIPYVLEINPLPGLDPDESNFPIIARAAGISYETLIQTLAQMALARGGASHHSSIPSSKANELAEIILKEEKLGR
jgi:D-alanine-D-alanine ligase